MFGQKHISEKMWLMLCGCLARTRLKQQKKPCHFSVFLQLLHQVLVFLNFQASCHFLTLSRAVLWDAGEGEKDGC